MYVFEHVWTIEELEGFVCGYGAGIHLEFLRAILGLYNRGSVDFVNNLVDLSLHLLFSGHQLLPIHALAEIGLYPFQANHPQFQVCIIKKTMQVFFLLSVFNDFYANFLLISMSMYHSCL